MNALIDTPSSFWGSENEDTLNSLGPPPDLYLVGFGSCPGGRYFHAHRCPVYSYIISRLLHYIIYLQYLVSPLPPSFFVVLPSSDNPECCAHGGGHDDRAGVMASRGHVLAMEAGMIREYIRHGRRCPRWKQRLAASPSAFTAMAVLQNKLMSAAPRRQHNEKS